MVKYTTKGVLLLALIASLISFTKFDHCYNKNWATPDVYVHACYSDISALYGARHMDTKTWPYSSGKESVEYPPLTGLVMWATALITPSQSFHWYFIINIFLIALLFMLSAWLLSRIKNEFWYLLPLTPAVIASLFINWDLWAVVPAIASIYFFDRKKYDYSAILLGISVAAKFFPIVLLAPIGLILFRKAQPRNVLRYGLVFAITWLVINAPFFLTKPEGWSQFFKLNSERGADFGSLWYSLQLLGINLRNLNTLSILLFLIGIAAFAVYFFGLEFTPNLASVAFTVVAIFTIASKVYSPQYVLWLTPLAILALRNKDDRKYFWVWQGCEALYHVAVWQYLASYTGAHFGLPAKWYAVIALIRIAACITFVVGVSTRSRAPQVAEFLSSSIDG